MNECAQQVREAGSFSPRATAFVMGVPRDMWLGIALGVSIVVNGFLGFEYRILEREVRMQEYYTLELDGKVIRFVDLPDGGFQRFKEKRSEGK